MYTIVVQFDVQPAHREDFIAAALDDARNSLAQEPGTRRFEVIVDEEHPNRFYFDETYDDAEAFQAHATGPHFARFLELMQDHVEGPTRLVKGTPVDEHASNA